MLGSPNIVVNSHKNYFEIPKKSLVNLIEISERSQKEKILIAQIEVEKVKNNKLCTFVLKYIQKYEQII